MSARLKRLRFEGHRITGTIWNASPQFLESLRLVYLPESGDPHGPETPERVYVCDVAARVVPGGSVDFECRPACSEGRIEPGELRILSMVTQGQDLVPARSPHAA